MNYNLEIEQRFIDGGAKIRRGILKVYEENKKELNTYLLDISEKSKWL